MLMGLWICGIGCVLGAIGLFGFAAGLVIEFSPVVMDTLMSVTVGGLIVAFAGLGVIVISEFINWIKC